MITEFDLINQYFKRPPKPNGLTTLGVGDDCALLAMRPGMHMAISSDMLVEGRHFFAGADPYQLGHKCLAVNLSDLAAMGAKPIAFTLAFALPKADPAWLKAFSEGLFSLADAHGCELIGGDTTKGPLTISITIFGEVPNHQALRRSAALVGDDIWVSGHLGDARLALAGYEQEVTMPQAALAQAGLRMHQPTPRVNLGLELRGIAHAAIDISDGLAGDLRHILTLSDVGATLNVDAIPKGPVLSQQTQELQRRFSLSGGDDYELCFTAPVSNRDKVLHAGRQSGTPVTRIGHIDRQLGLRLIDQTANSVSMTTSSFDHFSS
jgi:thiamine-monophosphate kinase